MKRTQSNRRIFAVVPTLVAMLTSSALAVKTQYFTHTTPQDFAAGTRDAMVITNHGELKLSRKLQPLLPADKTISTIVAMTDTPDGAAVIGTFPDGQVLSLKDAKLQLLATFDKQTITAMATDAKGAIVVAITDGEQAQLVQLTKAGENPIVLATLKDAFYIWSIVPRDGSFLLGVGTPARVIEVKGKDVTTIATLDGDNVLSLVANQEGALYAGTDHDGLVYRIGADKKPVLVFDASEAEISSLALDKQGRLLIATGEAKEVAPVAVDGGQSGRPEGRSGASSIPAQKPTTPQAPADDAAGAIQADKTDTPVAPDADAPKGNDAKAKTNSAGPVQPTKPAPDAEEKTEGNAVYRLAESGLVTEIFRAPVVIYAMTTSDDAIYIGTGPNGDVYQINPADEEHAIVAHTDAAQVSAIQRIGDAIVLATSNSGRVEQLSSTIATRGSYISDPLDAGVASRFGNMQLRGQLPQGASLTISTRSGNGSDPESGTWSDWSEPVAAQAFVPNPAPAARYLQYKLVMQSDGKVVPTLDEIRLAYQKPNIAPRVEAVTVGPDADAAGSHTISWLASDPNEDTLKYQVDVRMVGRGGWVKLADNVSDTYYSWPADRAADGRYEVRVTASDATDNPPESAQHASRVSETVVIDNASPVIGDVKVDKATVTLRVVDRNGVVAALDYALDSTDHWQRSLPDDTIADSPEERYTLHLGKLAAGSHTLTVRATDSEGNTSFEVIGVNVP